MAHQRQHALAFTSTFVLEALHVFCSAHPHPTPLPIPLGSPPRRRLPSCRLVITTRPVQFFPPALTRPPCETSPGRAFQKWVGSDSDALLPDQQYENVTPHCAPFDDSVPPLQPPRGHFRPASPLASFVELLLHFTQLPDGGRKTNPTKLHQPPSDKNIPCRSHPVKYNNSESEYRD